MPLIACTLQARVIAKPVGDFGSTSVTLTQSMRRIRCQTCMHKIVVMTVSYLRYSSALPTLRVNLPPNSHAYWHVYQNHKTHASPVVVSTHYHSSVGRHLGFRCRSPPSTGPLRNSTYPLWCRNVSIMVGFHRRLLAWAHCSRPHPLDNGTNQLGCCSKSTSLGYRCRLSAWTHSLSSP